MSTSPQENMYVKIFWSGAMYVIFISSGPLSKRPSFSHKVRKGWHSSKESLSRIIGRGKDKNSSNDHLHTPATASTLSFNTRAETESLLHMSTHTKNPVPGIESISQTMEQRKETGGIEGQVSLSVSQSAPPEPARSVGNPLGY